MMRLQDLFLVPTIALLYITCCDYETRDAWICACLWVLVIIASENARRLEKVKN